MAEEFRIILTSQALQDLEEIADYLRRHSPQNAELVADRLLNEFDSLAIMPARYKVVGTSRSRKTNVHAAVVRPHIVYFSFDHLHRRVYILTILHGHQRQPTSFS